MYVIAGGQFDVDEWYVEFMSKLEEISKIFSNPVDTILNNTRDVKFQQLLRSLDK